LWSPSPLKGLYTTIRPKDWHRSERIAVRRSEARGTTWSKRDLMLVPDRRIPFVNWGLMAPALVEEEDEFVLFFTAWGVERHACFPVPADGRFGVPMGDWNLCLYPTLGRAMALRSVQRLAFEGLEPYELCGEAGYVAKLALLTR
jgi:hypothetical protein